MNNYSSNYRLYLYSYSCIHLLVDPSDAVIPLRTTNDKLSDGIIDTWRPLLHLGYTSLVKVDVSISASESPCTNLQSF